MNFADPRKGIKMYFGGGSLGWAGLNLLTVNQANCTAHRGWTRQFMFSFFPPGVLGSFFFKLPINVQDFLKASHEYWNLLLPYNVYKVHCGH